MSTILKIRSLKENFTDSEEKIAQYIMKNKDKVYNLTALELAKNTDTSSASVIRFAKKIGFSGFQELKISLAKETSMDISDKEIYEGTSIQDPTETIMQKIASENINAIEDTLKLLDKDAIDRSAKLINDSRSINLFGLGSSYLVGKDLEYKLTRINKSVHLHSDYHLQLVSASNMGKEDIGIGISHSGKTKETLKAMKIAKDSGAKIISLTKFGDNPISTMADINLYTSAVEEHLRMGAISSRIAQLTVIDILFVNLIKYNYEDISKHVEKSWDVIDDMKIK